MRRRIRDFIFMLMIGLTTAGNALATTHYIAANGSDSNNGTSKSAPWAHLPGMKTWTGNYTPVAGDIFILRGCDVWGNANFPIHWTWSGTASNVITIDRDTTWFNTTNCPSAWNRAVFDAGAAVINPPDTCTGLGQHGFLYFDTVQWVTVNWIEMKRLFWNTDESNSCFASTEHIYVNASDHLTVDSSYFHDWTHGTSAGTTDNPDLIVHTFNASPYCTHCTLSNFVIDNSDGDGASPKTNSGGGVDNWSMKNGVCTFVTECFLSTILTRTASIEVSGMNISHVSMSFTVPTQSNPVHPNCFETTGVVNGTSGTAVVYIHDNYIHDVTTCEGLQVGNPNEDDYVWNNVWVMTNGAGDNGPQVPQSGSGGHNFTFWNNTVVWGAGCVAAGAHSTLFNSFIVENNHCVNDLSTIVNGIIPGAVIDHNLGMTNATATAQGYTSSETFVYSPTLGTKLTVGAGTNLTSVWPGGYSTNDTSYACTEQTVGGVVEAVCPTRTPNARPTSSAWDIGAYEFNLVSAIQPTAPASAVAVAH